MRVRVVVKDDGSVSFDYDGFAGKTCLEAFERTLEELRNLGIELKLVSRTMKVTDEVGRKENELQEC